jgi:predicted AAA+ superfamily ATPase
LAELHVIAAGSLLEFALAAEDFKMPVGRVQYLYLQPLSFIEFLEAYDKPLWVEAIRKASLTEPLPVALHETLLEQVRLYLSLGGMPAVVDQYLKLGAGEDSQRMQMSILETYRDDFAKYSTRAGQVHLQTVFSQLPNLVGEMTKYSKINPDVQSKFLKEAIHCLEMAGVVNRVYATKAGGIPLAGLLNFQKYKLFFLDVGLLAAQSGLSAELLLSKDLMTVNRGELVEQFVCQELLAVQPVYQQAACYCWVREKTGSMAEVDFVLQQGMQIVPLEVKAGKTGRLKSIQLMMEEKQLPLGIRVSPLPLEFDAERKILSVPLYMVSEVERLIEK